MELNEYVCGPQGAAVPLNTEQRLAAAQRRLDDIRELCMETPLNAVFADEILAILDRER